MPTSDGGDDLIVVGGPDERLGGFVLVLLDVPANGLLEIGTGPEDAASDPSAGNEGKEGFDGVEPRR